MEDESFAEQPISPCLWLLDDARDTKAITLRLDKTWIQKLDKLAYRMSNYERAPITKQLLIQKVIWDTLIKHPLSKILEKFKVSSEDDQVALVRQALKQDV